MAITSRSICSISGSKPSFFVFFCLCNSVSIFISLIFHKTDLLFLIYNKRYETFLFSLLNKLATLRKNTKQDTKCINECNRMSLNQNFEELSNIPSLSETWSVTITIILVGFGVAIHPHNGTGCKGHEAKMNTRILEEKTIHFYIQSTIKIAINAKKKETEKPVARILSKICHRSSKMCFLRTHCWGGSRGRTWFLLAPFCRQGLRGIYETSRWKVNNL